MEQKVGKDKVSEFTTDDSGTITTPLKLKYGNYQVEEITAPDGYLISEEEFPFVVEKDGAVKSAICLMMIPEPSAAPSIQSI